MAELGEFHKRRILVTFQHVEKLLAQSLHALTRAQSDLHRPDQIENQIKMIRKQIRGFLERARIDMPEPSMPASTILKTNMTSVAIALDDLHPKKLRGYGDMDSATAAELVKTLHEISKHVNLLLQALNQD